MPTVSFDCCLDSIFSVNKVSHSVTVGMIGYASCPDWVQICNLPVQLSFVFEYICPLVCCQQLAIPFWVDDSLLSVYWAQDYECNCYCYRVLLVVVIVTKRTNFNQHCALDESKGRSKRRCETQCKTMPMNVHHWRWSGGWPLAYVD